MWNISKSIKKGDYLYAVVKGHPMANRYGYVLYHRIVMENHLGRLLTSDEVVHHKNGDKKDNRINNLELMPAKKHVQHHSQQKGRLFCKMKCPQCGGIFYKPKNKTHLQKKSKYTCCSRSCRGKFSRTVQLVGLTSKVKKAITRNVIKEYRMYKNGAVS